MPTCINKVPTIADRKDDFSTVFRFRNNIGYGKLPKERKFLLFDDAKSDKANALQASYVTSKMAVKFKRIFSELDRNSWLNEKTRVYALGDGLNFTGHPLHLGWIWVRSERFAQGLLLPVRPPWVNRRSCARFALFLLLKCLNFI
jgi:hypothetical protein